MNNSRGFNVEDVSWSSRNWHGQETRQPGWMFAVSDCQTVHAGRPALERLIIVQSSDFKVQSQFDWLQKPNSTSAAAVPVRSHFSNNCDYSVTAVNITAIMVTSAGTNLLQR